MKRTAPLQRRTRLQRRKPWALTPESVEKVVRWKTGRPKNTGPGKTTRDTLTTRSSGRCELCGSSWSLVPHHRQPRGKGGSSEPAINALSNLLHLCPECHGRVENDRVWARSEGLLVRRPTIPASVQVHLRGGWVWIGDNGSTTPAPDDPNTTTEVAA